MNTSLKTFRPTMENLEDRLALSTVSVSNGDLYIYANNASNSVTVQYQTINNTLYYKVSDTTNGVTHNHYVLASQITGGDIGFYGYDGNDYFRNDTWLRAYAWGMNGNDTLIGGYSNDWLDGGSDSDYLYGRDGNDVLMAGYDYAYNVLYGGNGSDYLYGGYGIDYMYGEAGNDVMRGSYGNDQMFGGTGVDTLYGEYGNDTLDGGDDGVRDYLTGGPGADRFQRDWYWTGWSWANRDNPLDFHSSEGDTFYG